MSATDTPATRAMIQAGTHVCCRLADLEARRRLTAAFITEQLQHGQKVVYFRTGIQPADGAAEAVAGTDPRMRDALESGSLEIRAAEAAYLPDGTFDSERMIESILSDHQRAVDEGYRGLGLTGELPDTVPIEDLLEYERRLDDAITESSSLLVLCQYDHRRFPAGALKEIAASHPADVAPELAALIRIDGLSAARTERGQTLRLAGELDFSCADTVADVLDAHFHGSLLLDLGALHFVDVVAMRALRGRKGQRVLIRAASPAVRRMLALLGWDTDPDILVDDHS